MQKLTKGALTKERIYLSSKALFYKYGYTATTIQQIADHSSSSLGSMTYHFPTKDTFVTEIFEDYLISIDTVLQRNLTGYPPINSFERHFYLTMFWYHYLFNDPQVKKFYYEISKNKSLYAYLHESISKIYHDFASDYQLRLRSLEFDALLIADFGARREVTINYCEGKIKMPTEDYAIFILSNTARCFGIPQKEIYRVGYEALLFYRKHDFSEIKLLI